MRGLATTSVLAGLSILLTGCTTPAVPSATSPAASPLHESANFALLTRSAPDDEPTVDTEDAVENLGVIRYLGESSGMQAFAATSGEDSVCLFLSGSADGAFATCASNADFNVYGNNLSLADIGKTFYVEPDGASGPEGSELVGVNLWVGPFEEDPAAPG